MFGSLLCQAKSQNSFKKSQNPEAVLKQAVILFDLVTRLQSQQCAVNHTHLCFIAKAETAHFC